MKFIFNLAPDVIITNEKETLACAIVYRPDLGYKAPIVLFKTVACNVRNYVKQQEREGNCIYVHRPLAELLYIACDIGEEIPPELYREVAKVLSAVYAMRDKDEEQEE